MSDSPPDRPPTTAQPPVSASAPTTATVKPPVAAGGTDPTPIGTRIRHILFGRPLDPSDRALGHKLLLIPLLAWIGLGSDALSSSAYGPEEAFKALGEHTYLAVGLAFAMAFTVLIISAAYSKIIEVFTHGGGGYVVATKLLGERAGVVSGCALLVDYVLTITISIAAAGDALFSFLPDHWAHWKLLTESGLIVGLTVLNIRGVRESVLILTPIFIIFLITHAAAIMYGIAHQVPELPAATAAAARDFSHGLSTLGWWGMAMLFVRAFSLGGGTYTGIEAVSNGMSLLREPRVRNAKRTMVYLAVSLAITASGLILCYLLWKVVPVAGKTMNAVLLEKLAGGMPGGATFIIIALVSEGALLVVAAQAGFISGPRVLANLAVDSWLPRHFASLSERLTTENGILLMGGASLAALLYTKGDVGHIVVMYSINVFLTFSLSLFGMCRYWYGKRREERLWKRRLALFALGFLLCFVILVITIVEKFSEGGWVTLLVTGSFIGLCFMIRAHYRTVVKHLAQLYAELGKIPVNPNAVAREPDKTQPTAVVMVASYGGVGIHTMLNVFRTFPDHFKNLVFISVGVVDSGGFKGESGVDELRAQTEASLKQYVQLAQGLGVPATFRYALGTDLVEEAEQLCLSLAREFNGTVFFAGKVVFVKELWYHRLLHDKVSLAIQKRLQWDGRTMVILPARVR